MSIRRTVPKSLVGSTSTEAKMASHLRPWPRHHAATTTEPPHAQATDGEGHATLWAPPRGYTVYVPG